MGPVCRLHQTNEGDVEGESTREHRGCNVVEVLCTGRGRGCVKDVGIVVKDLESSEVFIRYRPEPTTVE